MTEQPRESTKPSSTFSLLRNLRRVVSPLEWQRFKTDIRNNHPDTAFKLVVGLQREQDPSSLQQSDVNSSHETQMLERRIDRVESLEKFDDLKTQSLVEITDDESNVRFRLRYQDSSDAQRVKATDWYGIDALENHETLTHLRNLLEK